MSLSICFLQCAVQRWNKTEEIEKLTEREHSQELSWTISTPYYMYSYGCLHMTTFIQCMQRPQHLTFAWKTNVPKHIATGSPFMHNNSKSYVTEYLHAEGEPGDEVKQVRDLESTLPITWQQPRHGVRYGYIWTIIHNTKQPVLYCSKYMYHSTEEKTTSHQICNISNKG
jgi:hypothetical protein